MARAGQMYYQRQGEGEPLLLVTGFAISAAVFEPVLDLYTPDFDCILYDHRGSARSLGGSSPRSMGGLADDAAGLLAALGVERAHVYGVSMGGMVAQEIALRHPQRVDRLILGCTSAGGLRAARPGFRELAGLVAEPDLRAAALFSSEFRRRHPERARRLLRPFRAHPTPRAGVVAQMAASALHDTCSLLGRIAAPTLVLHGERDQLVPVRNARALAERIPDAELAVVRGAGHAYALERPEEARDLLLNWMSRTTEERHVASHR
ncbi:MAG TPA: alpha/beta fold hydrolase [Solirubrobacteraceae bacterium]|nr:alpha/beta fold hydrolase [Solirubrobacteraceae bacterium]